MDDKKKSSSTILRGYQILEKIVLAKRPVSASELIIDLALPKPTVHRILQQLQEERLVQREPVSKQYLPGQRAREFASGVISNSVLGAPRHAILKRLSEEIGETCNCTMLDGSRTVYFDRVETNWPFRIQLPIGTHLPLHCTASGKLFLAFMDARQRKRLITAAPLQRYTARTITDTNQLTKELKRIKAEEIGVDNEEFMDSMAAIAVPVFNNANEICFTVAVHAPISRLPLAALREYAPSLKKAAKAMAETYYNSDDDEMLSVH